MSEDNINIQEIEAKSILILQRWAKDPVAFVYEGIGFRKYSKEQGSGDLTKQQKHALKELGKLVQAKIAKGAGAKLTKSEEEYAKKIGISIRAGQGPGKTTLMSWAMMWFLICHPNAICPSVAPTGDQLRTGLWKEIGIWVSVMKEHGSPLIKDSLVIQTDKIYHKDYEERKESWAATAHTVKDTSDKQQQGVTIRGKHGPYMMICIDEASGLPDGVFEPLQGTLTDPCNFVFMIFNPTKKNGYAAETQLRHKEHWIALHWSNEDCERIPQEVVQRAAETYGRDSDFFRVNVLGEFPIQGGSTFIPLSYIEEAFNREVTIDSQAPVYLGVDPAWSGRDRTVFCRRQGGTVGPIVARQGMDPMDVANWISLHQSEIGADAICIDSNGLGAGIYSRVREMGLPTYAVQTASSVAQDRERFGDLRSELIWNLRDWFIEGRISITLDHPSLNADAVDKLKRELIEELSILQYKTMAQGKIKFESKDIIKKKLGRSCDLLDALCYSFYFSDGSFVRAGTKDAYDEMWDSEEGSSGWMGV
jgi:hypothetical protein